MHMVTSNMTPLCKVWALLEGCIFSRDIILCTGFVKASMQKTYPYVDLLFQQNCPYLNYSVGNIQNG